MTKFGKTILFLIILAILGVGIYFLQKEPKEIIENDDWKSYPINDTIGYHACEGEYANDCLEAGLLAQVLGNKEDLISLSIIPNSKVSGILSYRGSIKGGYFFEANILINILDKDKKVLKASNAVAKFDWMTAEPVSFEGNIDFTDLPKGFAYFEIHNDNPSGLPENDKSVLIPIVIE